MTSENINNQNYQTKPESSADATTPEVSPDQAAARAEAEMHQAIGQVALPTANFREAPPITDSTITEVPEELKAVPEIVTEIPEHLKPR
jgi:hypothetical protein